MTGGVLGFLRSLLLGECRGCVEKDIALQELRRLALEERVRADAREKRLEEKVARYVEIIQGNVKQFAELAGTRIALAASDPGGGRRHPMPGRNEVPMVPGVQSLIAGGHVEIPRAQRVQDATGVPPEMQELAGRPLTPAERAIFDRAREQNEIPKPSAAPNVGVDVVGPKA